jgi:hypothetical protein
MLDNKLCLISVVEFLCRSRVDRDTREGKLVVDSDLSRRKVLIPLCHRSVLGFILCRRYRTVDGRTVDRLHLEVSLG